MNIIPVFSSDSIGRVIDNRIIPEEKENIRTKYIFYDIPDDIFENIEIKEDITYVTILEKRFKVRLNKLIWKKSFLTYSKLYSILKFKEPQVFFVKT